MEIPYSFVRFSGWFEDIVTNYIPYFSILLLPIFVYVHRKNRKTVYGKEKDPESILPKYFFWTTCFTQILAIIAISLTFIVKQLYTEDEMYTKGSIPYLIVDISDKSFMYPLVNSALTLNILVMNLAAYGILSTCSSSVRNQLPPRRDREWLLVIGWHLVIAVWQYLVATDSVLFIDGGCDWKGVPYALHSLMLLVGALYLLTCCKYPRNLSTNILVIFLFISKILLIPYSMLSTQYSTMEYREFDPTFGGLLFCEAFLAPVIIQLAFILSEKPSCKTVKKAVFRCKKWKNLNAVGAHLEGGIGMDAVSTDSSKH